MLRFLLAVLTLIALSLGSSVARPDDPPSEPAQNKSDLTEGLLDLLREPARDKAPSLQPSIQPVPANPTNRPAIDGEDIGSGSGSPLADIQLEMSTLAGWLRGKSDVSRTKELQRNIVLRLDEMIEQLEKQSSYQSNAASSSSPSATSQNQSPQNQSASPADVRSTNGQQQPESSNRNHSPDNAQRSGADGQSNADSNRPQQAQGQGATQPGQSSSGGNDSQSSPGQPGVSPIRPRSVVVDLSDPRALQRSAWGNLPERMREQMQSRMVERFLPPYRDEIEAYYRALVK